MQRAWQIASVVLAAVFGIVIQQSLELPLLDRLGPGPGFFPLCLSVLGLALAVLLLVQTSRRPRPVSGAQAAGRAGEGEPSDALEPISAHAWLRILSVLVLLAAVAFALDPPGEVIPGQGFRLTMLLFIALLLLALGVRNIVAVVLCAVLGSFGVFHVFNNWLKVILPLGPWNL